MPVSLDRKCPNQWRKNGMLRRIGKSGPSTAANKEKSNFES
jgi:hypothetical protein